MRLCLPAALVLMLSSGTSHALPAQAAREATALTGEALERIEPEDDFRAGQEELLREASAALARDPDSVDAAVWVGRRTAYLGRYRRAIEIYTDALVANPDSPELLRHRGHRWITVRELGRAVEDLTRAAELTRGTEDRIEEDGLPNERGIPTSTLQSNIWYHLGLAHYLLGNFDAALAAYRECLAVSKNPDMLVATSYWLYLTARRLGRDAEAAAVLEPIERDLDVFENTDYHRLLIGIKYHEGVHELWAEVASDPKSVRYSTVAYGLGAYHLVEGRSEKARQFFDRAVQSPNWAAFGRIAAEAELARLRSGRT